jgi:Ca2+-binding EF-hand superfamily protein
MYGFSLDGSKNLLVMFRIFDLDEDGVISRGDLIGGLNLLYAGTILEQNMIFKIADKIMRECEAYEGDVIQIEGNRFL